MLGQEDPQARVPVVGTLVSADHTAAIEEAQRLGAQRDKSPGSDDLLLALMRVGGAAARILYERGVSPARLEPHLGGLRPESPGTLRQLDISSRAIARSLGAPRATSLHLLLAILRTGGAGMDLLRASGQEPLRVRSVVMRALTGPGRFGERSEERPTQERPLERSQDRVTPAPVRITSSGAATPPAGRMDRTLPRITETRARAEAPARTRAESQATWPRVTENLADGAQSTSARAPGTQKAPTRAASHTRRLGPDVALELVEVLPPAHPVVHRERELERLLDLHRAGAARVLFISGEPGSGRSALAAALAAALPVPIATPTAGPSAATGGTPGAWLSALHDAAPEHVPILIDGCSVLGSEGSDAPAQLLASARMGRCWVLIGTPADLRRFEAHAPELAASIEIVTLQRLTGDALQDVVAQGLEAIAETHGLGFERELARLLVRLSPRYPTDRAQPGRALAVAELAAARAARLGLGQVTAAELAAVVADASGTPQEQLMRTDDERFRNLEERLHARVVGHAEARARVADLLRRGYAGFRGQRPLGSMLLLGPTGVGKTETARAIAEALFDDERALYRVDLSEYNEPHSVARLIGSPPGYVGHEEGGQLTEAIRRRPACVLLFDEFEKANREVLLLLLQLLDDGRLTDGRGRTVDFTSVTVVMTSNLGSELYKRSRTPPQATVLALARSRLPPELWNRIDEILCYAPLGEDELRQIVARIAAQSSARLQHERQLSFSIENSVVDAILATDPDRSLGARPLRRAFARIVEGPLAEHILSGQTRPGSRLHVEVERGGAVRISAL